MPSVAPATGRGSACTIFSPNSVGSVDTRKSIARFFDSTSFMRPSCGTRFSEMSSLRDHLDARGELLLDRERRLRHLAQHAVDAEADAVELLVRLEVDVGGAAADRVDQDLLQELDDRRVVDLGRCWPRRCAAIVARPCRCRDLVDRRARRACRPRSGRACRSACSSLSCSTMTGSIVACCLNLTCRARLVGRVRDRTASRLPRLISGTSRDSASSFLSIRSAWTTLGSIAPRSNNGIPKFSDSEARQLRAP